MRLPERLASIFRTKKKDGDSTAEHPRVVQPDFSDPQGESMLNSGTEGSELQILNRHIGNAADVLRPVLAQLPSSFAGLDGAVVAGVVGFNASEFTSTLRTESAASFNNILEQIPADLWGVPVTVALQYNLDTFAHPYVDVRIFNEEANEKTHVNFFLPLDAVEFLLFPPEITTTEGSVVKKSQMTFEQIPAVAALITNLVTQASEEQKKNTR